MTRTRRSSSFSVLALLALAACAVDEGQKPVRDPAQEEAYQKHRRESESILAKQQAYEKVLLDLDRLLDKYVQAVWSIGNDRADRQVAAVEGAIRSLVVDHFPQLQRTAIEPEPVQSRAIALTALGFSQRRDALDALLNGLSDTNPQIVCNAALGLGVLREATTPTTHLASLVTAEKSGAEVKRTASWALLRIQPALLDKSSLAGAWKQILATPLPTLDEGVAVHALRGLGLLREKELMATAVPFTSHPTPKVREAAAIALGMIGNPEAVETLLMLLGTAESNRNVALAARKALAALAGNVDVGFDVNEWRKLFQRGV